MATVTLTKFDMIQVGDRIEFPNSILKVKSCVIATIKYLNGQHKKITTTNGGVFHVSKWQPSEYNLFRTVTKGK